MLSFSFKSIDIICLYNQRVFILHHLLLCWRLWTAVGTPVSWSGIVSLLLTCSCQWRCRNRFPVTLPRSLSSCSLHVPRSGLLGLTETWVYREEKSCYLKKMNWFMNIAKRSKFSFMMKARYHGHWG